MTKREALSIIDDGLKSEGSSLDAVERKHRKRARDIPMYCLEAIAKLWLGTYGT